MIEELKKKTQFIVSRRILIRESSQLRNRKLIPKPEKVLEHKEKIKFEKKQSFFEKITNPFSEKDIVKKSINPNVAKIQKKEKILLSNDIEDCSDEALQNLVEDHKHSFVPKQYLNTPDEEVFKDYMLNYFIQFRDALEHKDVGLVQEIFKNSLQDDHLYLVSGYPVHVLTNIFSIVYSNNKEEFESIADFTAKNLSGIIKTKNTSVVDLGSLETELTNEKSLLQAYEIVVARARLSDINDPNINMIMTNDNPSSQEFDVLNNFFFKLSVPVQKNFDIFQVHLEQHIVVSKDVKISGYETVLSIPDVTFGRKKDTITFLGPLTDLQRTFLKKHYCDCVLKNLDTQLKKNDKMVPAEKKAEINRIKHLVIGFRDSTRANEWYFQEKMERLGYPFRSFVYSDSIII